MIKVCVDKGLRKRITNKEKRMKKSGLLFSDLGCENFL